MPNYLYTIIRGAIQKQMCQFNVHNTVLCRARNGATFPSTWKVTARTPRGVTSKIITRQK